MCCTRYWTQHIFNSSNTNVAVWTGVRSLCEKWRGIFSEWRAPLFGEDGCLVRDVLAVHNWSHLRCIHHNSCIYGNFQHLCKSTGQCGTLNWIFPSGWSYIPHFTRQHGRNSVLFWRPRLFEGSLANTLAWLPPDYFLWGYLKRRVCQNKPRTIDALKANISEEIQAVAADVLARTFQNRACWVQSCLDANGGHFQHVLWCPHISYTKR